MLTGYICSTAQSENSHCKKSDAIITQVWHTNNAWERMRGLLGRPALEYTQGLLIDRCNSVHTFGMKYTIDIVFLDKKGKIKKTVKHLKPSRLAWCLTANTSLELLAGSIDQLHLENGMQLFWYPDNEI